MIEKLKKGLKILSKGHYSIRFEECYYKLKEDDENSQWFNKELVKTLIQDHKIIEGDKLHFTKNCTVPRFKIKSYCESKNVKVVKSAINATVRIISDKEFINGIGSDTIKEFTKSDMITLKPFLSEEEFKLITEHENFFTTSTQVNNYLYGYGISPVLDSWQYSCYINKDNYDIFNSFVTSNQKVILEQSILKELNQDIIMDEEMYDQIKQLFESPDYDNIKLAMEMMANCNYDKSALYLLLLFYNYGRKISNVTSKNHVNFKSMIKYFEIRDIDRIDLNDIIRILNNKKVFDINPIDKLMEMVIEDCKSSNYRVEKVVFLDDEGNDIIINQLPEVEIELPDPIDPILFQEITEVIDYTNKVNRDDYTAILLNIRDNRHTPEIAIPIIKYLDENDQYELGSLLTNAYLNL